MRNLRFQVLFAAALVCGSFSFSAISASATVYLSPDASTDNQEKINAALSDEKSRQDGILTVHLKKGVYAISEPILIGSHTVLTGDKNAILKLADGTDWTPDKAMITNRDPALRDITISNFQIDGNKSGIKAPDCSAEALQLIALRNCTRLEVSGMYLYRAASDVFKVSSCSQVQFHGNIVKKQGGRAVDIVASGTAAVFDNNIAAACTGSLRVSGSSDVDIYGNIIAGDDASAGGIEIGSDNGGLIDIFSNKISGLHTFGILSAGSGTAKIYVHHNSLFDNQGGISIDQGVSGDEDSPYEDTVVTFNTIDANRGPAISSVGRGVVVQNNIFSQSGAVTGDFISRGNCFAHTEGATSEDTVVDDAKFADSARHDYHLQSRAGRWSGTSWVTDAVSSPCLDRGTDQVASEPFPNGCKSDSGRYGNTTEASLSGDLAPLNLPSRPETNSLLYPDGNSDGLVGVACFASGDNAAVPAVAASRCQGEGLCAALGQMQSGTFALLLILIGLAGLSATWAVALRLRAPGRTDLAYRNNRVLRYILSALAIAGLCYLLIRGLSYLLA